MVPLRFTDPPSTGQPSSRVVTFAFHVGSWKRELFRRYFPHRDFIYLPLHISEAEFTAHWEKRLLTATRPEILVWSRKIPDAALALARDHDIPVWFMEDGFIRSLRPSASRTAPLSLTMDRGTPYFDATRRSDLEDIYNSYDFAADPDLLTRARKGIDFLLSTGVSKYNTSVEVDIGAVYGPKSRRRILVVGQVEADASIEFGSTRPVTNNDLVRLAAAENPDAEIIYKPHPDILTNIRKNQSNPDDVTDIAKVVRQPLPLAKSFETIDHVYTITSLAGFEALLRGLPTTTLGCPFYAGWGLTDDRQPNPRRGRPLSIEALFAGAYLLYSHYFDPVTGAEVSFEETVDRIRRHLADPDAAPEPDLVAELKSGSDRWAPIGPFGLLGWRHLLPFIVSPIITAMSGKHHAAAYRSDPIGFFREISEPHYRRIGRILYPFDRK